MNHDEKILEKREELLRSGKYKGNTTEVKTYKESLPSSLNKEQIEFGIGLLLGDTTLQTNAAGSAHRLKTQQKKDNISLLEAKKEVFLPWVLSGIADITNRPNMLGLQTISHSAFQPLVDILHDKSIPLKDNDCLQKKIPPNIGDYLTPIAIGAWFCGDGSKRDHGIHRGKAIQFHTQGFSKQCCIYLAQALRKEYNWEVEEKYDYTNPKGKKMYLVQIEASSFDRFVEKVGYYILPDFEKRLPSPRSARSRFKS